jgi:enoyl-CoA hydratase
MYRNHENVAVVYSNDEDGIVTERIRTNKTSNSSSSSSNDDDGDDDGKGSLISIITIKDERTMNSLTKNRMNLLAVAIKREQELARCLIITGAGEKAFSAGINLQAAKEVFKMSEFEYDSDCVYQVENARVPIIAVVNGVAINAGFEIALACDCLIATKSAVFIDKHAEMGLLPSWGLSSKLSRIIGMNEAKLVSVFGVPLNATRAKELGLVQNEIIFENKGDALKEAIRIAREMILKSTRNNANALLELIKNGAKLPFGEARELERKIAFEQYRNLPLDKMFVGNRGKGKKKEKNNDAALSKL